MSHGKTRAGLSRSRRMQLYVIGAGVWLSGGMWLLYHYFLVSQGEFGPTANPLEPWWLKVHGAFAFAALWLFGLLWGLHITRLWASKQRRWSGTLLTSVFALLILTGYLLYYVADEHARAVISATHWIVGLVCPASFFWHRFRRRRLDRSKPLRA